MTIAEALQRAVQLHQQGQLGEAERLYREVLNASPNQPDACHLLGVLLGQRGEKTKAIDLIRRAIAVTPNEPIFFNNLGNLLRELGQLPAAADAFAKAIALRPTYFEAHNNLGNVQLDRGDEVAAAESYRQAVALNPADARLTINLGSALLAEGKTNEALAAYRNAVQLDSSLALGFTNYGVALLAANQTQAAIVAMQRAVELEPSSVKHQIHLAAALRQAGQFDQAEAACRKALSIEPNSAEAHNALANVLGDQGRTDESVAASSKAVALDPNLAEGHANLAVGFGELHRFTDAVAAFEEALKLAPDFADAHRNFGMALLTLGQFERGWREYEWRWKSPSFRQHACNLIPCPAPRWMGEPLAGRSILLQAEQGLGDTIQFARYIPLVAERGGAITVSAPKSLHRLLATVKGVHRVVSALSEADAATIEVQCPLMSLPLTLGLFDPSPTTGYFRTQLLPAFTWREAARRHIGLVWAGNPKLRTDRLRSIPVTQFAAVLALPGLDFFSLQLGPAAAQLPPPLVDHTNKLEGFADTAALIDQLDLVIAVDTAVAHLAGALGKPTWVLVPHVADWRWQLDRTDSPWYPSMRLFRQTTPGDWTQPIAQIAAALKECLP